MFVQCRIAIIPALKSFNPTRGWRRAAAGSRDHLEVPCGGTRVATRKVKNDTGAPSRNGSVKTLARRYKIAKRTPNCCLDALAGDYDFGLFRTSG